jgi:hypothetical protein
MYRFEISDKFLVPAETVLFRPFLTRYRLDEGIWPVFDSFFKSAVKGTKPLVIRVFEQSQLCGAAIVVRCEKYGRALFNDKFRAGMVNVFRLPLYLWIKYGCCMDMMSNPGFAVDPEKTDEIGAAIAQYLKKNFLSVTIYDYADKAQLYPDSVIFPAPPHALIDTAKMNGIDDYLSLHKNIKQKMRIFKNNGGTFEIVNRHMPPDLLASMKKCFVSTAENSLFYLPYQDLYLNAAIRTSSTPIDQAVYFVARLNGEFLGYQAAIMTGSCLNALHGAFDRDLKTTYHAYDLLFAQMTEFAINHQLTQIDFGSVINITKQRAVNKIIDLSYYQLSKSSFFQFVIGKLFRASKMNGKEQLQFIGQG